MLSDLLIAAVVAVEKAWPTSSEKDRKALLRSLVQRQQAYRTNVGPWVGTTKELIPSAAVLGVVSRAIANTAESVAKSDDLTRLLLEIITEACGESSDGCRENGSSECTVQIRSEASEAIRSGGLQMEGAVAHLISFCVEVASADKSVGIQRTALIALYVLVVAADPALVAAFLPGTLSKLVRILMYCKKANRGVAVEALRTTSSLILRAVSPKFEDTGPKTIAMVVQSAKKRGDKPSEGAGLNPSASSTPSNSMTALSPKVSSSQRRKQAPKSFRVELTSERMEQFMQRLTTLLTTVLRSKDGPMFHSSMDVQRCLRDSVGSILVALHSRLGKELVWKLAMICAAYAANADIDPVLERTLVNIGSETLANEFIGRLNDTNEDVESLFLMKALWTIFSRMSSENLLATVSVMSLEEKGLVQALTLHVFDEQCQLEGEPLAVHYISRICRLLGERKCGMVGHSQLLDMLEGDDMKSVAAACFVINEFLIGTAKGLSIKELSFETCISPEVLPEMANRSFILSFRKQLREVMKMYANDVLMLVDDSRFGTMTKSIVLDGIADVAERVGQFVTRQDILLRVLLAVLQQTNSRQGNESEKYLASITLARLCQVVGYESTADLMKRHLNFIIDSATRLQSVADIADVLKSVVTQVGAVAVELLADFVIREADSVSALGTDAAERCFDRMCGVLSAAKPTMPSTQVPAGPREPRLKKDIISAIREKLEPYRKVDDEELLNNAEENKMSPENEETEHEQSEEEEVPLLIQVSDRTLMAVEDALAGGSAKIQIRSLQTAKHALEVASLLQFLPKLLESGSDLDITIEACSLITFMFRSCPSFVSGRFSTELWPKLSIILKNSRSRKYRDLQASGAVFRLLGEVANLHPVALTPDVREIYNTVTRSTNDLRATVTGYRTCVTDILRGLAVADPDLTWALMAADANTETKWKPCSRFASFRLRN